MKKIEFWRKASNYSAGVVGIVLIAKMFFREYLENVIVPILFVAGTAIIMFLISELMKFVLKDREINPNKREPIKNYWKRFSFYDRGLAVFFIVNLGLDVINKKALNSAIPNEIVGYLFWLSLGLFLGFQLCKHEFRKVMEKKQEG